MQSAQQIVGRERRERELIADFQLPIVDLNSRRRVNSKRWMALVEYVRFDSQHISLNKGGKRQ
jgi:hypothetical protein